jgi:ferrochelatase
LNFAILPVRSPKVAKLYEQIWLPEGSPLRVYTNAIAKGVHEHLGKDTAVEVAMTYGSPSTDEAVGKLLAQGVNKMVVLPLYPQYSATTTAAAFDALNDVLRKVRNLPEIRFIKHYAHEQDYVELLAQSVRQHRQNSAVDTDLLLFSFHGLPKRYVVLGDPYQAECEHMAHQVVKALGLKENQWKVSYQSRVGKEEWVRPYTDDVLKELPENGTKKIDVICPAFAADCLETLEEIAIENKEVFMAAGGEQYEYIPALNDDEGHVKFLAELIKRQIKGWD